MKSSPKKVRIKKDKSVYARLAKCISIGEKDQCWLWKGGFPYPRLSLGDKRRRQRAYRITYQMFKGPISESDIACHVCDNPSCCNPDHIFIGTQKDNIQDCMRKNRRNLPTNEKHWKARLTNDQIEAIRADTRLQREIASDYNTDQGYISHIKHNHVRQLPERSTKLINQFEKG